MMGGKRVVLGCLLLGVACFAGGYTFGNVQKQQEEYYDLEDQDFVDRSYEQIRQHQSMPSANVLRANLYARSVRLPDRTCVELLPRRTEGVVGAGSVFCFEHQTGRMLLEHHDTL